MENIRKGAFFGSFRDCRQIYGETINLKLRNEISLNLYKSISTRREFICDSSDHFKHSGGIFNVEYSPDGSILLATTENKSVLMFGSNTHKLVKEMRNAHKSCVNLVKFLDSRMFCTCSDDNTIAIWDLRNLSQKIKSLDGHKNWVKSLEYDKSRGVLLSSAYDHSVFKWNINSCNYNPECVLRVKNMLRMALSPDCTKMVISTADGYLMVIHDLDLRTLSEDLKEFVPELYRLMQSGHNYGIDMGSWFNGLFTAKRNRVELITDFPKKDKNGFITTLEVHPFGWAVLSRNTSGDESTEWTCLHDIQNSVKQLELKPIYKAKKFKTSHPKLMRDSSESSSSGNSITLNENCLTENPENPIIIVSNQIGTSEPHTTILTQRSDDHQQRIYKNIPRLKYYIQELNENHGFIKEQSFSPDGRVVCSPYQYGYRLLSFNQNCAEMSDCVEDKPLVFSELKTNSTHPDYVVTTKFCPTYLQIASGCLRGRVVFSQPIL